MYGAVSVAVKLDPVLFLYRLKSVMYHFRGNGEFPRLRIGLSRV